MQKATLKEALSGSETMGLEICDLGKEALQTYSMNFFSKETKDENMVRKLFKIE